MPRKSLKYLFEKNLEEVLSKCERKSVEYRNNYIRHLFYNFCHSFRLLRYLQCFIKYDKFEKILNSALFGGIRDDFDFAALVELVDTLA